ncbi:MAG: hypothetical protein ACJAZY_001360 [Spirosomataceae bacterium]|jgi:hypothetical protein
MKIKFYPIYLLLLAILSVFSPGAAFGQQSANTVDYQVTYDNSTGVYSVWVVPNYNSGNVNNLGAEEIGATAQVSLKVPTNFNISTITNVAGVWGATPLKLGPTLQTALTGKGLPAGISYYVIGKGSSETSYGTFSSGVPVKLFTFTGNGCFGPVAILASTDNFVTVSDDELSLNTAPSFYSRSGQPAGGNQQPLEQFRAPVGPSANCLAAIDDAYAAQAAVSTNQLVLINDQFNGVTPATSVQVQVTIATNPPNGTVSVNPGDGSITYTANSGFAGIDTYTYTICDLSNLTVCSTATVTVTVGCPGPVTPTLISIVQPTCLVATGSMTISNYNAVNTYTFTGLTTTPTNTNGVFSGFAPGNYTVTSTSTGGCISGPASFVINAQPPTPVAPTINNIVQPTCLVVTGSVSVSNYVAVNTYTFTGPTTTPTNTNGVFSGFAPGSYTVTTTNGTGCVSSPAFFVINAQPLTPVAPTVSNIVQPTCLVVTGRMTISNYTAANTYTFTGPTTIPTNANGVFSGFAPGSYTVTTTNGTGCVSGSTPFTINAQPPTPLAPTVSAIVQPTCLVATGSITINPYDANNTYTFTGPTTTPTNTNGVFSGFALGSYTVTATNGTGCVSAPTPFTINAQPLTPAAPTVSAIVQPTCLVATGRMTVSNYNGVMTYAFTGPTTNPVNNNGVFSGFAPGSYTVTATNSTGCVSGSTPFTINAQPLTPLVPTVSAIVQPTCLVATGRMTVSNYNGAMTYTFTGPTTTPTNTNGVFSGFAPGSYTVTATNSTGCVSGSTPFTINAQPLTPVVPTVSSPLTYCRNAPAVALTATAPGGATLLWYTVSTGGLGSATAPVPPTTTIGSTTYYVSSVSTSAGVCESARVPLVVEVLDCRIIYAYNDNNITPKNTPVSGQVLTNDDINNGTVKLVVAITPIQQPTNGSVVLNANGTYTYTPNPNFVAVDSFRYRVCDQGSPVVCAIATVYINIYDEQDPINNNPPIALVDIYATPLNTPVTGSVLLNDKDPDVGQTLSATLLPNTTLGTLITSNGGIVTNFLPNGNGTFTYTPNSGFTGTDTFTYTACDNGNPTRCDAAVVQIQVKDSPISGQNMPPVAIDDYNVTVLNTPVSGNVSLNDKDSEPTPTALTVNIVPISGPLNGSIVLSLNGDYTYTPANGFTGVDQVVYETCDAGAPIECARATLFIYVLDGKVTLSPKAYLQGSLFGVTGIGNNLMRDDLRVKNLIPLSSPYPDLGFTALTATVNIAPAVLAVTGSDAIVDWVFVELRNAGNNQQVEDSRSALIQRDGDIVEVDGVFPITFSQASPGSYYVVIKHRNHLGVMTQLPIALSSTPATVDFTSAATPTFRISTSVMNQAQVEVEQGVAMWAGNALVDLVDGKVIYQGTANDVNSIYQLVTDRRVNSLETPFFKLKTYNTGDVNMNGETIFQGTGNDIEFIYQNVIKNHSGNSLRQSNFIIREQLP